MGWVLLPAPALRAASPKLASLLGEKNRSSHPPEGGAPAQPGRGALLPGTPEVGS